MKVERDNVPLDSRGITSEGYYLREAAAPQVFSRANMERWGRKHLKMGWD
jgi:hypothetical protein